MTLLKWNSLPNFYFVWSVVRPELSIFTGRFCEWRGRFVWLHCKGSNTSQLWRPLQPWSTRMGWILQATRTVFRHLSHCWKGPSVHTFSIKKRGSPIANHSTILESPVQVENFHWNAKRNVCLCLCVHCSILSWTYICVKWIALQIFAQISLFLQQTNFQGPPIGLSTEAEEGGQGNAGEFGREDPVVIQQQGCEAKRQHGAWFILLGGQDIPTARTVGPRETGTFEGTGEA